MTHPTNPAPPAEELREKLQAAERAAFETRDNWELKLADSALLGAVKLDLPALLDHLSVLTVENERMREAVEIVRQVASMEARTHSQTYWFAKARDFMIAEASSLPAMKGEG